jgi:hypothetical protein
MQPEPIPQNDRNLVKTNSNSILKSSRSWIGSTIVILATVFLILTFNEGQSSPNQRFIDSLFHNWFAMTGAAALVWLARRGKFGSLPIFIRILAGAQFATFLLVGTLDFVLWPPLWKMLKAYGWTRVDALPIAVMGVFAVWGGGIAVLVIRGAFRWFHRRYEHHGVALGFGPLYIYFRRRRVS